MRVTCSIVDGFGVEITRFLSTVTVDQVKKKKKDIGVELLEALIMFCVNSGLLGEGRCMVSSIIVTVP